jgi:hypothetical protein
MNNEESYVQKVEKTIKSIDSLLLGKENRNVLIMDCSAKNDEPLKIYFGMLPSKIYIKAPEKEGDNIELELHKGEYLLLTQDSNSKYTFRSGNIPITPGMEFIAANKLNIEKKDLREEPSYMKNLLVCYFGQAAIQTANGLMK